MRRTALAWLVHLYTASGLVAALLMAVLIVRGGDDAFRAAFALMIVASIVDATDGMLARAVDVKHVLPDFDGSMLDNVTDFHTYTTLPVFLLWRANILPGAMQSWLILPVLASAYGYSQLNAKTADGFFLGFPSLWNVVAFYLYVLQPPASISATIIAALSVATFVPVRYLYPSRGGPYARLLALGGVVWALMVAVILSRPPGARETLTLISLTYPLLYLALSWSLSRPARARYRAASIDPTDAR